MVNATAANDPPIDIQLGGLVDPRSCVYVHRSYNPRRTLEEELAERLRRFQHTVIIGSRQTGKSSLANYVGLELERKDGFRRAWVDLDTLIVNDRGPSVAFLGALALELGVPAPVEASSMVQTLLTLMRDDPRPVLLTIDELDRIIELGEDGALLVRALRSVQQDPRLRHRFVLCVVSVRAASMLYGSSATAKRFEAPAELIVEPIPIGLFDAADETRKQLARCFLRHDPDGAENLARWVLEESGGYPQLCMALAQRLINTGTRYTNAAADRRAFFSDQVRWFRDQSRSDKSHFLQTTTRFLNWFPPQERVSSLITYRTLLDYEAARGTPDETSVPATPWDESSDALYRLRLVGLARRDGDVARTLGGFMDRFFDRAWVSQQLDAAKMTQERQVVRGPRPRICVLITGGTIGMVERDGQINPPEGTWELEKEYDVVAQQFDVEWIPLENLDSANVGPREWRKFAQEIHRQLQGDVSGVVVAHGTDTLAYTASAVAFALGENLSKPVVFTGSQTTVDQVHGDARSNLLRACMVAAKPDLPEVVIVFDEYVLRAVRAVKRDDRRFDAFESFLYPPLGMVSESVELQPEVIRPTRAVPLAPVQADFRDGIVVISQAPGLSPAFYRSALAHADTKPAGMIIQTLGAGNIPTMGEHDLTPVIVAATDLGIPVLLASPYPVHLENLGKYGPSFQAINAGAIPIANMTMAATVAKLSWVLGRSGDNPNLETVQQQMLFPYVGELSAPDAEHLRAASGRRV